MRRKTGWFVVTGAMAAALLVRGGRPALAAEPDAAALQREFLRVSGARLVFDAAELPAGSYHDVMVPLPAERRVAAARIALAEVHKYPAGYLGDLGLGAIGVFAACVSKQGDGFRPYDKALGGYRYYGIWNGKDGIAAAYYGDQQLPLTLHHEIFHHVDGTALGRGAREHSSDDDARFTLAIAGLEPYAAPVLSVADRAALGKLARGVTLEDAVSDYAAKSPGEDQSETARHFLTELPDALLQVATQPRLAGSQRMLHVMSEYAAALPGGGGPGFAWWVEVALGRSARGGFEQAARRALARVRAHLEPMPGRFVVWGEEDASGVNWTLRGEVASFGAEARLLGTLAHKAAAPEAKVTRAMLERVRLLGRYLGFIGRNWKVSDGTRRAFADALARHFEVLTPELAAALRKVTPETLGDLVSDEVLAAPEPGAAVLAGLARLAAATPAARRLRDNKYLANVDAEIADKAVRAALRAVQPATVKLGGGSGVNLAPGGLVLTAGHVPKKLGARLVAVFPDGSQLEVECTRFDAKADLALMTPVTPVRAELPWAPLARRAPVAGTEVVVIGQPGKFTPDGEPTGYQPFHVSTGKVRGYRADFMGAQALGGLKHDAWTYWGHSGSPLFDHGGAVVGIHNSWDSTTAMRHAVPHQVIVKFLKR